MKTLVIGSGLLGSSVGRIGGSGIVHARGVPWQHERAAISELDALTRRHVDTGEEWAVLWCAGSGVVGTRADALAVESRCLAAVLDAMSSSRRPGRLFLASSAGGIHGVGSRDYITERTPPSPSSEYGLNKLRQEQLVTAWGNEVGGAVLIGRISNLYGPGQSMDKSQGLVSQALARCLLRRTILLSVPEETQRDFIFVDDAAGRIVSWLQMPGADGVNVKLLACEHSITLARLFRVVRAVTRLEPRIVRRSSATTQLQPRHLRFRSVALPEIDALPMRPIEVGLLQTWEHLLRQHGRTGLSLP